MTVSSCFGDSGALARPNITPSWLQDLPQSLPLRFQCPFSVPKLPFLPPDQMKLGFDPRCEGQDLAEGTLAGARPPTPKSEIPKIGRTPMLVKKVFWSNIGVLVENSCLG